MKTPFLLFLLFLLSTRVFSQAFTEDDLKVLPGTNNELLHSYLLGEADKQFEARRKNLREVMQSKEGLQAWQEKLRAEYRSWMQFPEKGSLNAKITTRVKKDGYNMESVVFESRLGHHVTGNMYIPSNRKGKIPGVLVTCGHSYNGKALEVYQSAAILLAQNGIAAFLVDPFGQGERFQLLHTDGKPSTRGGTIEHTFIDYGANLLGTDAAAFQLWDNVRALDYLESRKDIDPERLGVTGNSGGGTQTTFIMAFDDRVKVAAPSCYLVSKETKFHTIGGQDGCQQFYGEGPLLMEENDFIIMRAPKPTIMLAAEQDYFDFNGAKKVYAEVKEVYDLLGAPEKIDLFSYDDTHGFTQPRREAMVQWMKRWLLDVDEATKEEGVVPFTEEELLVTSTGQVATSFDDEELLQQINLDNYVALQTSREQFLAESIITRRAKVAELCGYVKPEGAEYRQTGKLTNLVPDIIKIELQGEVPVPGLLFRPKQIDSKLPVTVYAGDQGKYSSITNGTVDRELQAGRLVFAVDLRGFGETQDDTLKNNYIDGTSREWRTSRISLHMGRPLIGQRASDISLALNWLEQQDFVDMKDVKVISSGLAGTAALHAAFLDPRIKTLELDNTLTTWKEYLDNPINRDQTTHLVPQALKYYDLGDLIEATGAEVK
ncbi:MAG: acetylxylan esterase [Cyclobacteriaceae bacterium]|nr:acetylxylan esterase [Cyclobacteriaceae bacterium]